MDIPQDIERALIATSQGVAPTCIQPVGKTVREVLNLEGGDDDEPLPGGLLLTNTTGRRIPCKDMATYKQNKAENDAWIAKCASVVERMVKEYLATAMPECIKDNDTDLRMDYLTRADVINPDEQFLCTYDLEFTDLQLLPNPIETTLKQFVKNKEMQKNYAALASLIDNERCINGVSCLYTRVYFPNGEYPKPGCIAMPNTVTQLIDLIRTTPLDCVREIYLSILYKHYTDIFGVCGVRASSTGYRQKKQGLCIVCLVHLIHLREMKINGGLSDDEYQGDGNVFLINVVVDKADYNVYYRPDLYSPSVNVHGCGKMNVNINYLKKFKVVIDKNLKTWNVIKLDEDVVDQPSLL